MSVRYFCDGCGDELTPDRKTHRNEIGRLVGENRGRAGMIAVEVMIGLNGTMNNTDVCDQCLAAMIASIFKSRSVADVSR